ncbi:MAG: hypothetical protein JWN56_1286 [Sphingobacteriales bacterium]|nr:hypothetical protein [Sphingobacteriales bacterium]
MLSNAGFVVIESPVVSNIFSAKLLGLCFLYPALHKARPLPTIKMRTTIRLIITFYKSFAFASNLITLSCLYLIIWYGEKAIYIVQALFWFKIITLGLIFYYIQSSKKDEFYYYKNLGLTKKHLWISTLTVDFILFLILFFLTLRAQ